MNGFIVIDKPGGMTSRDVVNRIQKCLPRRTKLGHTGTLDPLATGVLVIGIGAATRLTELVQDMPKTYHSRFRLGARSTTDDADGEVTEVPGVVLPTREQIDAALPAFLGAISQVPPQFSAAKLAGQRAYDLARKGETVDIAPRTVRIDAIRIAAYDPPSLDVEIDCGKGTYIRSIARDLGERLGCGGYVVTLRRTRIGEFHARDGVSMDASLEELRSNLKPMSAATVGMPRIVLDDEYVVRFRHGQLLQVELPPAAIVEHFAIFDRAGELVGLASRHAGLMIRPVVVFKD